MLARTKYRMIKLVYRNDVPNQLEIPKEVLPADGKPQSHHFQSTVGDNLIELAGRICYDSCSTTTKTRGTREYHEHINEVNHGSTQEHFNLTVRFTNGIWPAILSLLNRPGFHIHSEGISHSEGYIEVTYNIRCINDWFNFDQGDLRTYNTLLYFARLNCPLATRDKKEIPLSEIWNSYQAIPHSPEEIWLSFYISNVSRGLTHEWVRHKYHTAVSQRSTRYVDESNSGWTLHPLILENWIGLNSDAGLGFSKYAAVSSFIDSARNVYAKSVEYLEKVLVTNGIDKFSARKQARGAARGMLGNALSTELIWSASLDQIKRVITQRASAHADSEIRLLANQLWEIVEPLYPEYFKGTKHPCPDGIGYEVRFCV